MSNRRLSIESKCDRSRYKIELDPDAVILSVTYRHFAGRYEKLVPQKVEEATMGYYRAWKTDGAPETENETYWYTRALYEHYKKPFWYFFRPTNTLVVVPSPPDDGSLISVLIEDAPEEFVAITTDSFQLIDCPKEKQHASEPIAT